VSLIFIWIVHLKNLGKTTFIFFNLPPNLLIKKPTTQFAMSLINLSIWLMHLTNLPLGLKCLPFATQKWQKYFA